MNKLRTARVLMAATILLIISFQAYWMRKLYHEETNNFKKTTDIIFRDAMYKLQVQRFSGDTTVLRGMLGDNLFMTDFISSVEKIKGDTSIQRLVISMNGHTERITADNESSVKKYKQDTIINMVSIKNNQPPPVKELMVKNKHLSDSIPLKRVDSMYRVLLAKEGVDVNFYISKTSPVLIDSGEQKFTFKMDEPGGIYSTKRVPVGLINPIFYSAEFRDPGMYVLRKISMPLLLSALLIALTIVSFIFIYRSLLAQKRLTEIKNDFIGNITHELKTPIATVSVAIEAMKNFNALQKPERTKEYLDISANELQRLSLLVDKVLSLSMYEMNEIEIKKEKFDLQELLNEVLESMKPQFEKQHALITIQRTGSSFMIEADKRHISSVIYNLLDNALKYSRVDPQMHIQLIDQSQYLELRVKDHGVGIADEYRKKIFEQFFRVPSGDKHNIKGYGLGLSYVNYIVQSHRGIIEVESELGKGSTFIVKLPFAGAPGLYLDKKRKIKKEFRS